MPKIRSGEDTWEVPTGTNLRKALQTAGIWMDAPCGGRTITYTACVLF